MKRPGPRLNIQSVMEFIKMNTPDDQIIDHYRSLHFDVRMVTQMIKRCKMKLLLADKQIKRTMAPIDPRQDWNMRVWRKAIDE